MALFDEIKRDLGYRWTDTFTEDQIQDYINDGMAFLSDHAVNIDFEHPGVAKTLLKEYVRYCVAGALPEYRENYRKELLRLSNKGMVERRKSADADADI